MSKAGKKRGKKGKKDKKKGNDLELTVEDRLKRTSQEVDILKQQLVERQEYAQRSKSSELSAKQRLAAAKTSLAEEKVLTNDLAYDLTRQYKTLQLQSETRIQMLEATVRRLNEELTSTKKELTTVISERDRLKEEKENEVAVLNARLESVQKSYDSVIAEALDGLTTQLEASRTQWDKESVGIDHATLNLLENFGNPLIHRRNTQ